MLLADHRPVAALHAVARSSHAGTMRTSLGHDIYHAFQGMVLAGRRTFVILHVEARRHHVNNA